MNVRSDSPADSFWENWPVLNCLVQQQEENKRFYMAGCRTGNVRKTGTRI